LTLACALRKKNAEPGFYGDHIKAFAMGWDDRGPAAPLGAVKKRTSAWKRTLDRARASPPSGVGHAEALALAAQPLEPAEAQRPALTLAPVRRSPTKAHGSF
jgi:hypothetical protein